MMSSLLRNNSRTNDEIWLSLGKPCLRYDGREVCYDSSKIRLFQEHPDYDDDDHDDSTVVRTTRVRRMDHSDDDDDPIWELSQVSYPDDPTTIMFGQHFLQDLKDTSYPASNVRQSASTGMASWFPSFQFDDSIRSKLGYLELNGMFVGSGHYKIGSITNLTESSDALMSGPMVIFDTRCALVMSTASSFMSSSNMLRSDLQDDGSEFGFGVMGSITTIPKSHRMSTILSSSSLVDGRPDGIRNAFTEWGAKLQNMHGTKRPSVDVTLDYLQYSTDNGAYYYYNTEPNKTYEETMLDVKDHTDKVGLPIQNWLMDSWWYYKALHGGGAVKNWTARPDIFPNGISNIRRQTEWDIVAHNRYWSNETDYAIENGGKYKFVVEGDIALPVEEEFWNTLFEDAKKWGLTVYEQDWLNVQTERMNYTLQTVNGGRDWLIQMGNAAKRHNILIQYCMSWPRHIMQSLEVDVVTQARASGDYQPNNDQWSGLGISSMFSWALGIAPLKDNFWSSNKIQPPSKHPYKYKSEPANILQSIVATWSRGSVAPSDHKDLLDVNLIMQSCAANGQLLRPDVPAVRTDATIFAQAGFDGIKSKQRNEVWISYTNLSGYTYTYVLAADSPPFDLSTNDVYPNSDGTKSQSGYIVFELNGDDELSFNNTTTATLSTSSLSSSSLVHVPKTNKTHVHAFCIAPKFDNGWIFLGEAQTKWTAVSKDRFSHLVVHPKGFSVSIKGAPNEVVFLYFWSPKESDFVNFGCTLSEAGRAWFDTEQMACSETGTTTTTTTNVL